jgi:Mrp family chromosome partitioning ATPase
LTGEESLEAVTCVIDVESQAAVALARVHAGGGLGGNGGGDVDDPGRLALIPSGPRPANPPAILGSERMHDVLDEIQNKYDVVIVDSPPLLAVSDALPLASLVDGTVLVMRLDSSTTDSAARLMGLLDRVPDASVLGVVANDAKASGDQYYGRYYGVKRT